MDTILFVVSGYFFCLGNPVAEQDVRLRSNSTYARTKTDSMGYYELFVTNKTSKELFDGDKNIYIVFEYISDTNNIFYRHQQPFNVEKALKNKRVKINYHIKPKDFLKIKIEPINILDSTQYFECYFRQYYRKTDEDETCRLAFYQNDTYPNFSRVVFLKKGWYSFAAFDVWESSPQVTRRLVRHSIKKGCRVVRGGNRNIKNLNEYEAKRPFFKIRRNCTIKSLRDKNDYIVSRTFIVKPNMYD